MILPAAIDILTLGLVGHMTSIAFTVMKGALENLKGKSMLISPRLRAHVLPLKMFRTPLMILPLICCVIIALNVTLCNTTHHVLLQFPE